MKTNLTVGITTHNDYDGVFFTLQALRMYHPNFEFQCVLVDQNPDGPYGNHNKNLMDRLHGKYIRQEVLGPSHGREACIAAAETDWVLLVDGHVLLEPGGLDAAFHWIQNGTLRKDDLLSGPLVYDSLAERATHWTPGWNEECFGTWARDERVKEPSGCPFEIPMNGVGLMLFNKDYWPGYNPHFRGFGAEEWYIHRKYRAQGGRVMCVPMMGWLHRFGRLPHSTYPLLRSNKIFNHLLGDIELNDLQQYQEDYEHWMQRDPWATKEAVGWIKELRNETGIAGPHIGQPEHSLQE